MELQAQIAAVLAMSVTNAKGERGGREHGRQLGAAEKAGVDAYWVMRTLRRNSVMAARRGDIAASNRAAELVAKHLNMFVERKEFNINVIDDSDEYLAKTLAIVSGQTIDNELPALPAAEDGQKYGSDEQDLPDPIDIIDENS